MRRPSLRGFSRVIRKFLSAHPGAAPGSIGEELPRSVTWASARFLPLLPRKEERAGERRAFITFPMAPLFAQTVITRNPAATQLGSRSLEYLLSPALSSIRWRRGRQSGAVPGCAQFLIAVWCGITSLAPGVNAATAAPPQITPSQTQFFETKIRPLLTKNCYKCHSSDSLKLKGELLLDTRDGLLKGGATGPAIVPGDPEKSLLIKAVRYTDPDIQMPPKGDKLSVDQINDLVAWVKMGAPDPRVGKTTTAAATVKGRDHWSFKPILKPAIPSVRESDRVANPIDAFVLSMLENQGMKLSPPADRRTLIRRAYYDLIGLPPGPEEVQAFLDDTSPDAFAKVVDRLLASPRYGERWGRHWLDVARYSDTKGEIKRHAFLCCFTHMIVLRR